MGHISKHSKGARFIAFFVIYFQWYLFLHPPSYLSCFILNFCFGTLLTKVSETLWCSQKNLQANTHLHTYTRTDTPVSTVTVLQRAESAAAADSTLLHCTSPRQKKSWFQILLAMRAIDADWSISKLVLDMAEDCFAGEIGFEGNCWSGGSLYNF